MEGWRHPCFHKHARRGAPALEERCTRLTCRETTGSLSFLLMPYSEVNKRSEKKLGTSEIN